MQDDTKITMGVEAPTLARSQALTRAVFEASLRAVDSLAGHLPQIDRDRAEYAVASVLFEEAWVSAR